MPTLKLNLSHSNLISVFGTQWWACQIRDAYCLVAKVTFLKEGSSLDERDKRSAMETQGETESEQVSCILTGPGVRSQKIPLLTKHGEIKTLFPSGRWRGSEERAPGPKKELMQRHQGRDGGRCCQGKSKTAATHNDISNCCNFLISFQGKESGEGKYGLAIFIFNF